MEPNVGIGLLWFLMIALMFFAQHHTCDAYFVPAINVFVEKMRKSKSKFLQRWGDDAVAGATICALGCNGPELFSNLISLYTASDAGIGVVVGSEIFNLLIIIGASVICAPAGFMELERVPFVRDSFFYFTSIIFLYVFMSDKSITMAEALILLGMAAVYVATVYFTDKIVACLPCIEKDPGLGEEGAGHSNRTGRMHGVEVEVKEIHHSRMADGRRSSAAQAMTMDATGAGIHAAAAGAPPMPSAHPKHKRASVGFQYTGGDAMMGPMLKYSDLSEVLIMSEGIIHLIFRHGLEKVTLAVSCKTTEERDQLLRNIEEYSLGRSWTHVYDPTIFGAFEHLKHALFQSEHPTTLVQKLLAIPHFIIDFSLRLTLFLVDVKDIRKETRWVACFMGSMTWLAIFSYIMLVVADQIHYNIPILSQAFLGITVCAIGTSFPNAVASVIMAKQNKPAAAVANALGSNVQNVFLAMAAPWVIYSAQALNGGPIEQKADGIKEGVLWMMGTLILVIFFVLLPATCTINKSAGYILVLVFVVYLSIMSYEALAPA